MSKKSAVAQYKYSALRYSQRDNNAGAPAFLIFHASADDITNWADVDRLSPDNHTGAQRPLQLLKVRKVGKYFKDPKNTIPTSIVIALDEAAVKFTGAKDPSGVGEQGTLTISQNGQEKPGLIIDGQHRAFGAAQYSGDIHLNVVAFLGEKNKSDAERAFQFVVINNTASRVKKDHIKALNLSYDKQKLNKRLIESAGLALAMNDQKYDDLQAINGVEPFKGLLKIPTNANGFIAPNAIEGAMAETRDRSSLLAIEDLELEVFLAIWAKIRNEYSSLWSEFKNPGDSRLLIKVSIFALTIFVLETMHAKLLSEDSAPTDFTDQGEIEAVVKRTTDRIPEAFWTADWKLKELDTAVGRQQLVDALKVIVSNSRNGKSWYDNVPLIDPTLLKGQKYEAAAPKPKAAKKVKKAKAVKAAAKKH
ncbi:DGQHR domain-containing protein [Solimonas sp. SE-A11]|uniref:DGQHR domain-containing protein n=1 Tax=Solimonas sp. SE-A11 TaxID=3054954 RepID=UPI00259CD622|nr:DGQHR domain-containing protein [Solimonas sp. SE-A11]